ncbi:TIR domain-containing protein [Frankia sp. AiPs1]|uniref:TIR domain-containing protein n=1 Tax=Frankia sp. AiPa1 TaxID=573492 RepID=UPI00202B828C|nr:TIR domain-containing protein [Frankia sp. AiPa1]MCL9760419.1 TIR domain-containing protein [Frankia sp. AiPa1]
MPPCLDERLRAGLNPTAAAELENWCVQTGVSYRLVRWLTNGRSSAVVAAVVEQHRHHGARQLVMKLDRAAGEPGEPRPGEYAQHENAMHDAEQFARAHLSRPVREPVFGGEGWWYVFQSVAGGSLSDPVTLQTLLNAVLHPPRPHRGGDPAHAGGRRPLFPSPRADAATFAAAGADVVRSTLAEWSGPLRLPELDVPTILRRQLGHRAEPGGAVHRLAQAHPGATLTVEGEDRPLPNPFSLLFDEDRCAGTQLMTFLGRAHGDLHVENVLVPASLREIAASYQLIDLARYSPDAVLTRDPTHLVLHVLARTLSELGPQGRTAAIDMLLDPEHDGALLPTWMASFIVAVRAAAEDWARASSLVEFWREQVPLSLLAGALTCLVRPSTRPEDHAWFLRLAANAAATILDRHAPPGTEPSAAVPSQTTPAQATPARTAPGMDGQPRPSTETAGGAGTPRSEPATPDRADRRAPQPATDPDVLISHASTDEAWATWIGWHLEEAGWRTRQVTVSESGQGWVPAATPGPLTLILLSPAYPAPGPAATSGPGTDRRTSDGAPHRHFEEPAQARARDRAASNGRPARQAADRGAAARRPGTRPSLLAVRVEPCDLPASRGDIEIVDLVGLGQSDAHAVLLRRLTALLATEPEA